jgi:hypothetical protein
VGERNVHRETDQAVLVLDVELDRIEARGLHRDVLVELPGQTCERHRHVDAAYFGGQRPRLQTLRLRGRLRPRCCAHRLVPAHMGGNHASDHPGRDQCEQRARGDEPLLVASFARLGPPELVASIRIDRLEDVPRRQGVEN